MYVRKNVVYLPVSVRIYMCLQYSTCVSVCACAFNTIQYSTIQYSTVQYNTVQYCTVQYNTVQYCTVQYSTVQYNTVLYSTVQYSTVQYSTERHTIQHAGRALPGGVVLSDKADGSSCPYPVLLLLVSEKKISKRRISKGR